MSPTIRQLLRIAVILAGLGFIGWGVLHFNDPFVRWTLRSQSLPEKRQYVAMAFGVFLIYGGWVFFTDPKNKD